MPTTPPTVTSPTAPSEASMPVKKKRLRRNTKGGTEKQTDREKRAAAREKRVIAREKRRTTETKRRKLVPNDSDESEDPDYVPKRGDAVTPISETTTDESTTSRANDGVDSDVSSVSSSDDLRRLLGKIPPTIKKALRDERKYVGVDSVADSDDEPGAFQQSKAVKRAHQSNAKFQTELKCVREQIATKYTNADQILLSDLDVKDKARLFEWREALDLLDVDTVEYFSHRDMITQEFQKLRDIPMSVRSALTQLQGPDKTQHQQILESIVTCNHPANVQRLMYQKLKDIESEESDEYVKVVAWVRIVLSIPTTLCPLIADKTSCLSQYLVNIRNSLDRNVFGMVKAKTRVIEMFASMLTNPKRTRKCMAFVGPPGVGKTWFARCLSESLGLPYDQISLGGINDVSCLVGHNPTYVSARPGMIVESLARMKHLNGILVLDEFDKLQDDNKGYEVISSLLHILDTTQNTEFKDHYLTEVPIDLSNVIFVLTLNNLNNVDKTLADRLTIVEVGEYKFREKIRMAIDFLLPRILKVLNLPASHIICNDKCMVRILNLTTEEKGVRNLERNLQILVERLNILHVLNANALPLGLESTQCDVESDAEVNFDGPKTDTTSDAADATASAANIIAVTSDAVTVNAKKGICAYYLPDITFPVRLTEDIVDALLLDQIKPSSTEHMYV
jgi:ATP-dependent Clp protease ATP-binding subunit ClpA